MNRFLLILVLLLVTQHDSMVAYADSPDRSVSRDRSLVSFDMEKLSLPPEVFPAADELQIEGVRTLFYRGIDYRGNPTRVFAYYGIPAIDTNTPNGKLPAMVLIHGGGGTAFHSWVKLWNSRGYAAIAMDLCGCVPVGTYGNWQRHEHGGPPGWDACFGQLDEPIEDQWTYQAVSAVALAHSLVRSFPEIDRERIGVTGISWGGYLTSVVAGVDSRFRFACPVYGCGFLAENSVWLPAFEKLGPERSARWTKLFDPSSYLKHARMPILWVNGTNDFAYPMDSWQKSYRQATSPRTLCLRMRMPHGHGVAGETPEELHVFANSILQAGKPLPKILDQGNSIDDAWATFESEVPISNAELIFTKDRGKWVDRKWEQLPATIDASQLRVSSPIPADGTVFYFNLYDDRGCAVSTQHVER